MVNDDALPTRAEIDVFGSADEADAYQHFGGKTIDEAEALFRENSLRYQEDLMWMGPRAFKFYLPAATRYLASDAGRGDSALVEYLLAGLRWRRDSEGAEALALANEEIRQLAEMVVEQHAKFEFDERTLGEVLAAYRAML